MNIMSRCSKRGKFLLIPIDVSMCRFSIHFLPPPPTSALYWANTYIPNTLSHCFRFSIHTMAFFTLLEVQRIAEFLNPKNAFRFLPSLPLLSSSASTTATSPKPNGIRTERKMGDTEVSYFLPSRESGVNDMYLHLGCRAPPRFMERRRVALVWAIMRVRHPLLASKVRMNSYEDISFVYDAPLSSKDALFDAERHLDYRSQTKEELIDSYLNGPRTLSQECLSYLIVSHIGGKVPEQIPGSHLILENFDLLICATHFLGDGMALHQFANDFSILLGSDIDGAGLADKLAEEWGQRVRHATPVALPLSMECRLPSAPEKKISRAATRIDFALSQQSLIGGHNFPRRSSAGVRHTIVPTMSFAADTTKAILKNCKSHGVSISAALFAICNVAWARTHNKGWEMPIMMYSALNMRGSLQADKRLHDSYWFLAIGYFNVVLPSFFPASSSDAMFWHRARSAKAQSTKAAKTTMVVSRCREMATERGSRARVWAKEDDDKLAGITTPKPQATSAPGPTPARLKPKVPSSALLGLSLLGNLDGIYKHSEFPDIKYHTLTTGSRQRSGGMLLFGYTFAEKLWISLGYDENGFEEETVRRFWENALLCVDEFLVPST
ncbi:hypothetical protein D9619_002801 [Psilocybe cf. subviscida]|uniref:Uncharacterized protein n=1 Tax=Psilocybe cf. subviscida TaxID=2480587 RepID=A0A8H5AXG0_9AGAR|nr:hypothetical protein D9619_002801 [Psilocybe cf. subviscida]